MLHLNHFWILTATLSSRVGSSQSIDVHSESQEAKLHARNPSASKPCSRCSTLIPHLHNLSSQSVDREEGGLLASDYMERMRFQHIPLHRFYWHFWISKQYHQILEEHQANNSLTAGLCEESQKLQDCRSQAGLVRSWGQGWVPTECGALHPQKDNQTVREERHARRNLPDRRTSMLQSLASHISTYCLKRGEDSIPFYLLLKPRGQVSTFEE